MSPDRRTQLSDYMTELTPSNGFSSFTGSRPRGGGDIFLVEYVVRWAATHGRSESISALTENFDSPISN